jgi:hypothetical protein
MDNTINRNDTGIRVDIDQTRNRQTPKTDFGSVLATGLDRTGAAISQSAQIAAPFVPGGAVLSAAISGVGSIRATAAGDTAAMANVGAPNSSVLVASSGMSGSNMLGSTGSVTTGGSITGGGTTVASLAAGGNANAVLQQNAAQMQEMNQSFNMQYLMLQEHMQQEQRQFSLLSNVMKTRHDGAKNVISNVR